jgi:hypothetical protein
MVVLSSAPGCGQGDASNEPCVPGTAQPCDCGGGRWRSIQFCADDTTWNPCSCGSTGTDVGGDKDAKTSDDANIPIPWDADVTIPLDADLPYDTACVAETAQAYKGCGADGDLHWFDSCDAEGSLVQDCTDAEACVPDSPGGPACRPYCEVHACRKVLPTDLTQCFSDDNPMDCTDFPCETDGTPDFCGQDAQYPDNARSFACVDKSGMVQNPCDEAADSGETVMDSLTGLIWQRTFLTEQTWQEAKDYCDGLTYGGHDDWRLPSYSDLAGLVRFGSNDPALDLAAFPEGAAGEFWTSSMAVASADHAFAVDFASGGIIPRYCLEDRLVRCVRGTGKETYPPDRFSFRDGTTDVVVDRATGLQWQYNTFATKKWKEALRYCEGLTLGGQGDWRLPRITELVSLADVSRSAPATAFPGMPALAPNVEGERFWSSTAHPYFRDQDYWGTLFFYNRAWTVDFVTGAVLPDAKAVDHRGLCVRAGP